MLQLYMKKKEDMKFTILSYLSHCLTYVTLINLGNGVPLVGKEVRDAGQHELTFVVYIRIKTGGLCTGTLISEHIVVTAAHCLDKLHVNQVDVIVGSRDIRLGKLHRPKWWISYDQWRKIQSDGRISVNDIAVITLSKKVNDVQPAYVSTIEHKDLQNLRVQIAGWGLLENGTKPWILQTATLTIISNDDCESKINSVTGKLLPVFNNCFCNVAVPWVLGNSGDSGAPILYRNQVVGIHIGLCPSVLKNGNLPKEFACQNYVNLNLHLHYYKKFIEAVTK